MTRARCAMVMTYWPRARSEIWTSWTELLNEHFEVTAGSVIGPGRPGQVSYFKRITGYTENLPDNKGPGFFWTADPKHVDFLVQWTKKRGGKPAVTPGTKATGMGARDTLELLSRSGAREVAGAAGTALYLSSDRPDTMFASKTAMQHVSKAERSDECQVAKAGSILRRLASACMVLSLARVADRYPEWTVTAIGLRQQSWFVDQQAEV